MNDPVFRTARSIFRTVGCIQILGFLLFLMIFGIFFGTTCIQAFGGLNYEYSNGSRSGVVQKISKKGLFWETWEGELNLGYMEQTEGGLAPAIFYFSVSDDDVAKQVQDAEQRGGRTTLEYKQYLLRGFKYGGTPYDIVGVK